MKLQALTIQAILIFVLIISNTFINLIGGSTGGNNYFYITCFIFFIYGLTCNFQFRIYYITKLYAIIVAMSLLSIIYAPSYSFLIEDLPRVLSNFISLIIISTFIKNTSRLIVFLTISSFCILLLAIPNVIWTSPGVREMYWGGVNPVGTMMFFGIVFSVILLFYKKKLYIFFILFFFPVIIISQSQKIIFSLLLMASIFILGSILIKRLKSTYKYIFFLCIFSFILYGMLVNTSLLDSFERTSRTYEELSSGESVSGSALGSGYRNYLLKKGVDYFTNKPLFGYGLNQYRHLHGKTTGVYTYSHNTWIELLVSFGLFVAVSYLYIYIYMFKIILKNLRKNRDSISLFLLSSLIAIFVIGLFQKMFYDVFSHLYFVVIYMILYCQDKIKYNES